MTKMALVILVILPFAVLGDSPVPTKTFHHCTWSPGRANSPHLFDVSDNYTCDEGPVEITGTWGAAIEYGYVFADQMGKPDGQPRRALQSDYESAKWCPDPHPWDPHRMVRCRDKPTMCWEGRMGTWDPEWQGFSCVTPDHHK